MKRSTNVARRATQAKPPTGAGKKHVGPFLVPADLVFLNNSTPKEGKIAKIMEDPEGVLSGKVDQRPTRGAWCPERRIFVLRNGNNRRRVAAHLGRASFLLHEIHSRTKDETWRGVVLQHYDGRGQ